MVTLSWSRFSSLIAARNAVGPNACVYVQADPQGCAVRVGKAGGGLVSRYNGGTGYALDAAMHQSGNLIFVALVPALLCLEIEETLIWAWRDALPYNNNGKRVAPRTLVEIEHRGEVPSVRGVSLRIGLHSVGCDGLAEPIAACSHALPGGEVGRLGEPTHGGRRNLEDEDLDVVVRKLRDEGLKNVSQIHRQLRRTPHGTNINRLKASFARVNATSADGSTSPGSGAILGL